VAQGRTARSELGVRQIQFVRHHTDMVRRDSKLMRVFSFSLKLSSSGYHQIAAEIATEIATELPK
jgi:hypothetical protein